MKYSLILGTVNRLDAIKSCIQSIFEQTYKDYEVIIIDQSDNLDTENFILGLDKSNIIYRHVNFKGLSRARNEALKLATGEYFCLMDDDAYYEPDYLESAIGSLEEKVILSGYIFDTIKEKDFVQYNNKYDMKFVSLRMIMRTCPSAALIIPMKLIGECGMFDEEFGVGARYGSGEETDLLLRAIDKGFRIKYLRKMRLKHPVPIRKTELNDVENALKREKYYEGLGALYKKHIGFSMISTLKPLYWEEIIKFVIKKILYTGVRRRYVDAQYMAFKKGYKNYNLQKVEGI